MERLQPMLLLWGLRLQTIPSNNQRAKLLDIILCGRDLLKVARSENTFRLLCSYLHKAGKREITVVIERCGFLGFLGETNSLSGMNEADLAALRRYLIALTGQ